MIPMAVNVLKEFQLSLIIVLIYITRIVVHICLFFHTLFLKKYMKRKRSKDSGYYSLVFQMKGKNKKERVCINFTN